jgi:hypothetical protein
MISVDFFTFDARSPMMRILLGGCSTISAPSERKGLIILETSATGTYFNGRICMTYLSSETGFPESSGREGREGSFFASGNGTIS